VRVGACVCVRVRMRAYVWKRARVWYVQFSRREYADSLVLQVCGSLLLMDVWAIGMQPGAALRPEREPLAWRHDPRPNYFFRRAAGEPRRPTAVLNYFSGLAHAADPLNGRQDRRLSCSASARDIRYQPGHRFGALRGLQRVRVGCTTGRWAIGHSEQRRRPRAASGCTGRQAIGHSEQRRRPRAVSSHLPHHIPHWCLQKRTPRGCRRDHACAGGVVQGELPESGRGAGRPVGSDPTPIPALHSCPGSPPPPPFPIFFRTTMSFIPIEARSSRKS
jgi:hypothetical protein